MTIIPYDSNKMGIWNKFNAEAKNGNFMFDRNYMEYHANRFKDASLLFYEENTLVAILPASLKENAMYSHGGLTFGGFIFSNRTKQAQVLALFDELINYLKMLKISILYYKPVPNIYHSSPAEEDIYALFRNNAVLIGRNAASVLNLPAELAYSKGRKWSVKKAKSNNLKVEESSDFEAFFNIEKELLAQKYDAKPVHSVAEMSDLAAKFPENIRLFCCYADNELIGGVLVYINRHLVHCQYIGANEKGYELGAIDFLIDYLLDYFKNSHKIFDFGTSNADNGHYLEKNLIQFKESFGGRTTCYDIYKLEIPRSEE